MYRYKGVIAVTGNIGRFSGDSGWNAQNLPKEEMFGVEEYETAFETPAADLRQRVEAQTLRRRKTNLETKKPRY